MSKKKPEQLTPAIFSELTENLNISVLTLQGLLGMHSGQIVRGNEPSRRDKPLSHAHSAICLFLLRHHERYMEEASAGSVTYGYSFSELMEEYPKYNPIRFFGHELDVPSSITDAAILTLKGYSVTNKRMKENTNTSTTDTLSRWIGIILYCLQTNQQGAITDILETTAKSIDFNLKDIRALKGWPGKG